MRARRYERTRNFTRSTSVCTMTILNVRFESCSDNNSSSIQEIFGQYSLSTVETCSFRRVEMDSRSRDSYGRMSGAERSDIHARCSLCIEEVSSLD